MRRKSRTLSKPTLLSAEEEWDLCQRAQAGDQEAKERLVKANMGLVHAIAKRYLGHQIELEDLVQEGCIGLLKAIERMDTQRGFRLSTYASWWIQQAVNRAVEERGSFIHVPAYQHAHLRTLKLAEARLMGEEEDASSIERLAQETGLAQDVIETVLQASRAMVSLDAPLNYDDGFTLKEMLMSEETLEDRVLADCFRAQLADLLDRVLSPRESLLIKRYYGFEGDGNVSYRDLGALLGVTRQRVRQIFVAAMFKLRTSQLVKEQFAEDLPNTLFLAPHGPAARRT